MAGQLLQSSSQMATGSQRDDVAEKSDAARRSTTASGECTTCMDTSITHLEQTVKSWGARPLVAGRKGPSGKRLLGYPDPLLVYAARELARGRTAGRPAVLCGEGRPSVRVVNQAGGSPARKTRIPVGAAGLLGVRCLASESVGKAKCYA